MTFKEVYAAWKAEKKTSIRPSSFSTYVILMEKHVLPLIADKGPITESDVTAVREAVLASGTSERTAHDAVNVLMSILRYAGQQGWWPAPTWTISHAAKKDREEFRLLSVREQRALMDHFRGDLSPANIGLFLALTAGVTIGELSNLTWQDIDYRRKVLHVRGIVARYYRIEDDVKVWSSTRDSGASNRMVPLAASQVAFLKADRAEHFPELFIMSNSSTPMDARVIRRYFQDTCKKVGLKGVQFGDLRHSFAVRFLEAGGDYTTLSAILGVGNLSRLAALYEKHIKRDPRKDIEATMVGILG